MSEAVGVSTLSAVQGGVAAADLHHAHQMRDTTAPGDRMMRIQPFSGPKFDAVNELQLNTLNMVVDEVYIEFRLGAIPTTPGLKLEPTSTWLGPSGVQLFLHESSMYQMLEAEAISYEYLNQGSHTQFVDYQLATNDWSYTAAGFAGKQSGSDIVYMKLGPIANKIMNKFGSINAHQPKSISLSVDLKRSTEIVSAASGTPSPPDSEIPINTMRLILVGHREDRASVAEYQRALLGEGIEIRYSQPNYQTTLLDASTTGFTVTMPQVSGDVDMFVLMQRNNDELTERINPESSRNLSWLTYDDRDSTLDIGTSDSPSEVFGLAQPQKTLRLLYSGRSLTGGCCFMDTAGELRKTGMLAIPLGEHETAGQMDGVYSGAMRVQNNLQFVWAWSGSGTTANTRLDTLVYVRKRMRIGADGFSSVNE